MMLIQIPVFIGLYTVIRHITQGTLPDGWIYSFFAGFGSKYLNISVIDHNFLGMDLTATKNIILTILAA
jgi:membrane protein insertase Oxa1/YidC/SpoIIIJ